MGPIYQACAMRAHAHDYAGPKILFRWLGMHAALGTELLKETYSGAGG